ncbi:MAG: DUF3108 domain-containing protein [Pseudomonadales bacterium]
MKGNQDRQQPTARKTRVSFSYSLLCAATLSLASSLTSLPAHADLKTYAAEYQATIKGMGVRMHRTFTVTGSSALVETSAKKLIFGLKESSQLDISEGKKLRVVRYSHKRKNLGDRHDRELSFDWNTNAVTDQLRPENKPLAIEYPVFDKLSYQEQFRLDLAANPMAERLEYQVTEGQRTRLYAFDRIAEEQIDTPLGKLNSVKFKRDRGENSDRETYIWFATDWSYLLARLDQIEEKGAKPERLELKRAKVDGQKVKGL